MAKLSFCPGCGTPLQPSQMTCPSCGRPKTNPGVEVSRNTHNYQNSRVSIPDVVYVPVRSVGGAVAKSVVSLVLAITAICLFFAPFFVFWPLAGISLFLGLSGREDFTRAKHSAGLSTAAIIVSFVAIGLRLTIWLFMLLGI